MWGEKQRLHPRVREDCELVMAEGGKRWVFSEWGGSEGVVLKPPYWNCSFRC